MVGQISDGVDGLLGRPGGDKHLFPGKIVREGQLTQDILQNCLRLRQLALAHGAAGKTSAGRFDDFPAITAQKRQIVLGHRVFKHVGIHGGGDELGAAAGENGGGEHIVRQPVGQFRANIGRGRGDDHKISPFRQSDMLHLMGEIPVEGVHHRPAAGELLESQGCDELGGVFGHDDLHRGVLLDKGGGQRGGFIGGDSAGNAQKDGFSFQHREPSRIENCLRSLYPDFESL